ncbi:MAG: hypothetical protein QXO70_03070 [Candidatus Pacearchaeota archaeon]
MEEIKEVWNMVAESLPYREEKLKPLDPEVKKVFENRVLNIKKDPEKFLDN